MRPAIYYFDKKIKKWVKEGRTVSENKITIEVNHFTKFAVLAEEQLETEKPEETTPLSTFIDIQGHWAEVRIQQLVQDGAIQGYPDGTFKPNQTITRAEFVVIVAKAFGIQPKNKQEATFHDVENHLGERSD